MQQAGFRHVALIESDKWCCETLRKRRSWKPVVREIDLREWTATRFADDNISLFSGGVPCPPFSRAGAQLGREDERDLFPTALRLIAEVKPRAVMLENVRNIMSTEFEAYRAEAIDGPLFDLGYIPQWRVLLASDYGVPQLRPRAVLVALRPVDSARFRWPQGGAAKTPTVGQALRREMASRGWQGAGEWAARADRIAPTLVGGSKKHGGPDLGPSQAKRQWLELGVNAHLVADEPPSPDGDIDPPCLTVRMAAILQGFPVSWPFAGKRTNAYRQVGNAFPPPVALAVGRSIVAAFEPDDETMAKGRCGSDGTHSQDSEKKVPV